MKLYGWRHNTYRDEPEFGPPSKWMRTTSNARRKSRRWVHRAERMRARREIAEAVK